MKRFQCHPIGWMSLFFAFLLLGAVPVLAQPPGPADGVAVKVINGVDINVPPDGLPVQVLNASGRTPWNTRSQILPAGGSGACFGVSDCANYVEGSSLATFDLPPVPEGKVWVVESASGGLINGIGRTNQIELLNNRGGIVFDGLKWVFAGPFLPGSNSFGSAVFSANLYATFGPGETPSVRVSVAIPDVLSGYAVIVFNGYLIDAE